MQLGINLMDNNQALFSPSPSRPGKLRDETEKPGVSERGTRSGPALWNSSPPRRYGEGQPEPPLLCLRRSRIPYGIGTGICLCINYWAYNKFGFCFFKRHWVRTVLGPFFIVLWGSRTCHSLGRSKDSMKVCKTLCCHSWLSQGLGPHGMAEEQPSAILPTPELLQVSMEWLFSLLVLAAAILSFQSCTSHIGFVMKVWLLLLNPWFYSCLIITE